MTNLGFKNNFFYPYLVEAPVALALERTIECELLKKQSFKAPVLDIGCGEGMFAHILFDGKVDTGIDPNPRELERAKEYNAYKELICCWGNNIPKADKSYNTVFSNSVLEHIPDVKPVLTEIHRLMADDARFIATVPTNYFEQNTLINTVLTSLGLEGVSKAYRKFFNSFWQHYHCYDIAGWEKLFNESGLEVEQVQTYCPPAVGIFNDVFSPIAIVAFVQKKYLNKWFVFPGLRKLFASIWKVVYRPVVSIKNKPGRDGLVMFVLKKKNA